MKETLHEIKAIIPQQETSGNYNRSSNIKGDRLIIPQQETSGNYNLSSD